MVTLLKSGNAALVTIEDVLHQFCSVGGNLFAAFVENVIHLALADDLAQSRFGSPITASSGLRLLNRNSTGSFGDVLDCELDIDDVLVVR